MTEYGEPQVCDPFTLKVGDQVACADSGPRLRLLVSAAGDADEIWMTLDNEPGKTGHLWDDPELPVRRGNVALNLVGQGWTVGVLPQVLARRRIR